MAILEALRARGGFTKTDEALADYILAHADEAVRMSVSELAAATYTSSAAVNRLCRKVGSSGFRAFRVDLNTELERVRAGAGVSADLTVRTGESVSSIMASVAAVSKKAIDACSASLSPLELSAAAHAVALSQRVVLFAGGDSAVSCEQFANDLMRMGKVSAAAYRYEGHWVTARLARRGDCALFVSYSGGILDGLADQMAEIHRAGAKVIVVTARPREELPKGLVDHYLQLPAGEDIVGSVSTFFSQMAMRYVLCSLYATAYSLDAEASEAHRAAVIAPDWMR